MNSIDLPFTPKESISVKLPKGVDGVIYAPKQIDPQHSPELLIANALRSPLGSKRISESVTSDDKVLIICDDITRPTPTKTILPVLIKELNTAGVVDRNIEILFALGTHRPMTDEEMINKIGLQMFDRFICHNHDAYNKADLNFYGISKENIPVWLNKRVREATITIGIGDLVPHPIAGFSGGAKILYPGVAGEETIRGFHVSFGLDPQNHYGSFTAPSRGSIHELAAVVGLDFLINTIVNEKARIVNVFAGNYIDVYDEAKKVAQQVYGVPTQRLYDVVVVSSFPAWLEFWQGGKGIYAAATLAKPGGEIILASACPEGVARTHPDFGPSIGADPSDVVKGLNNGSYSDPIGAAIAVKLGRLRQIYNITLISQGIDRDEATAMGIRCNSDLNSAIELALEKKGHPMEVGIIPYGGNTYCYL